MAIETTRRARRRVRPEVAGRDETRQAINGITQEERRSVVRHAEIRLGGKEAHRAEDFVQDALCRVLQARRRWPKGVDIVSFLKGVVRSLIGHWRKKSKDEPDAHPLSAVEETAASRPQAEAPEDDRRLDLLAERLTDNPVAATVFADWRAGLEEDDIREKRALTDAEIAAAKQRIRREAIDLGGLNHA